MRTTTITRAAATLSIAVGVLSSAAPASAAPECRNKGLEDVAKQPISSGRHLVLSACRGESMNENNGQVWREYGMINIGPRATAADSCKMKLRSWWDRQFSNKISWRDCTSAIRRGSTFTYYGRNTAFPGSNNTRTEACFELRKGGRRLSGTCVMSDPVPPRPHNP